MLHALSHNDHGERKHVHNQCVRSDARQALMSGRLAYFATLKLWDVTAGEENAALLFESDTVTATPLSELKHYWPELLRQAFKSARIPPAEMHRVEGVNVASLRVSLSRNNGAGITRRRFNWKGREYLVTLHVDRAGLVNVMQKLKALAMAPGRRPVDLTFWHSGAGDWVAIEFDTSVGVHNFPEEFMAAHPVEGEDVSAALVDKKTPSAGRTALLYELEPV